MAEISQVITVGPNPGTNQLSVGVALLKGIDNAARNSNSDFGIYVTVTYLSVNNTIVTAASGRVSIKNGTAQVGPIDNRTVAIQFNLSFGTNPEPGPNPSYTCTSQVVNKDPTGNDIELGPSEQSQL